MFQISYSSIKQQWDTKLSLFEYFEFHPSVSQIQDSVFSYPHKRQQMKFYVHKPLHEGPWIFIVIRRALTSFLPNFGHVRKYETFALSSNCEMKIKGWWRIAEQSGVVRSQASIHCCIYDCIATNKIEKKMANEIDEIRSWWKVEVESLTSTFVCPL